MTEATSAAADKRHEFELITWSELARFVLRAGDNVSISLHGDTAIREPHETQ